MGPTLSETRTAPHNPVLFHLTACIFASLEFDVTVQTHEVTGLFFYAIHTDHLIFDMHDASMYDATHVARRRRDAQYRDLTVADSRVAKYKYKFYKCEGLLRLAVHPLRLHVLLCTLHKPNVLYSHFTLS